VIENDDWRHEFLAEHVGLRDVAGAVVGDPQQLVDAADQLDPRLLALLGEERLHIRAPGLGAGPRV
jgi:hypothetical protein